MEKTLDQVRELFPEAEQIADEALRQKVYRAWLKVWQLSGCDALQTVTFLPGGMLPDVDNITHTRAIVAMSLQFAEVMKSFHQVQVNRDHIIAGALLHDLGKYLRSAESSKIGRLMGHAFSAAYIAIQEDLPIEVVHIISAHSGEGDMIKRSTEAAIVHYMDQAYTEVILRAKTNINREEFHKLRIWKQILRDEAQK